MFRYIAIVWNQANPRQQEAGRVIANRLINRTDRWQQGFSADGCEVFYTDARAGANQIYTLDGGQGVIVGKLFERDDHSSPPRSIELSEAQTTRIVTTSGQHLIDRFWGRYVAIWRDPSGRWSVLRDPTGTLPCYTTKFRGVHVFFSWLDDWVQLDLSHFSVNWDYISALLPLVIIHSRSTGLQEVTQLLQGERVQIDHDGEHRALLWMPARVATGDVLDDTEVALSELRRRVQQCVHLWASCYPHVLHRMSGGLDSTIVLSCLKNAPTRPEITGLIHYTPTGRSDERPFARLAAANANCKLVECERNPEVQLEPLLQMHPLPEPHSCAPFMQNDRLESRIAAQHGATAMFSGAGGDQLFFQGGAALAASDYIDQQGIGPGLFKVAHSGARLSRVSVWNVLRSTIARQRGKRQPPVLQHIGKSWLLLRSELVDSIRKDGSFIHPWLVDAVHAPAGKQHQIYGLMAPHVYYDPRGNPDDAENVAPLSSQPLIETSLRIPTYVLTSDGWDRALARRAFCTDMPAQIVTRRTKGTADELVDRVLRRNLDFVKALLLDGQLVRRGFIDRFKLEDALSGSLTAQDSPSSEIIHYLTVESWLQNWQGETMVAAA